MARTKRSLSTPPTPTDQDHTTPPSDQPPSTPPSAKKPRRAPSTPRSTKKVEPDSSDDEPANKGKSSTPRAYNPWTKEDKQKLLGHINEILKEHLWQKVKSDKALASRQSSGVTYQWTGLYKKLLKETEGKA